MSTICSITSAHSANSRNIAQISIALWLIVIMIELLLIWWSLPNYCSKEHCSVILIELWLKRALVSDFDRIMAQKSIVQWLWSNYGSKAHWLVTLSRLESRHTNVRFTWFNRPLVNTCCITENEKWIWKPDNSWFTSPGRRHLSIANDIILN